MEALRLFSVIKLIQKMRLISCRISAFLAFLDSIQPSFILDHGLLTRLTLEELIKVRENESKELIKALFLGN